MIRAALVGAMSIALAETANLCWAAQDGLSISNPAPHFSSAVQLAQGGAGAPAGAGAAVGGGAGPTSGVPALGTPSTEGGWLSGLHVSGFLSQPSVCGRTRRR